MRLIKTGEHKLIQDVPWMGKGTTINGRQVDYLSPENYPHIFSAIYNIVDEDNTPFKEVVFGDIIWRIIQKNGKNPEITCVTFSKEHINKEIFADYETCNAFLQKQLTKINDSISKADKEGKLQELIDLTDPFSFGLLSLHQVSETIIKINKLLKDIKDEK